MIWKEKMKKKVTLLPIQVLQIKSYIYVIEKVFDYYYYIFDKY